MKVEIAIPVLNLLCKTPPRSGQRSGSIDPGWNCDPQSLLMKLALEILGVETCQIRGALYAVLQQPKSPDGCEKVIVDPHYYCFAEIDGQPFIIDPSFAISGFNGSKWEGWEPLGLVAPLTGATDLPCSFRQKPPPSDTELFDQYTKGGAGRFFWYCGEDTSGSLDDYLATKQSAVVDYLKTEFGNDAELCLRKAPSFLAEVILGKAAIPAQTTQRSAWELVLNVKTTHPSPSEGSD
jgi:hypothetical protein